MDKDKGGIINVKIKDGKWECKEDKMLQNMLNLRYNSSKIIHYSPWVDYELARMANKEIKNIKIIIAKKPVFVKDRIY